MARLLQLSDLHVVAPGTRASGVRNTGPDDTRAAVARDHGAGPLGF